MKRRFADTVGRLLQNANRNAGEGSRGFSLVESLAVLLFVSIIALMAIPSFAGLYRLQQMNNARDMMMSEIQFSRMNAVKEKVTYQLLIRDKDDGSNPNTFVTQNNSSGSFVTMQGHNFVMPETVEILASSMASMTVSTRGECTAGQIDFRLSDGSLATITITTSCNITAS